VISPLAAVAACAISSRVKVLLLVLLCVCLAACEAIRAENDSPAPIQPARPDPFGGSVGSSSPY
jgi:hypothetical protein